MSEPKGIDWKALAAPFPSNEIEWRVAQAGKGKKGVWAKVLAYVTNRAIMQRLDDVVGPPSWANRFAEAPGGGILCGIEILVDGAWVCKWDGAAQTEIEAVKGGLSGAMKRAAVQWGIGRYLYDLEEGWANVHDKGMYYGRLPQKAGGDSFHWDPPALPNWALPGGKPGPSNRAAPQPADEGFTNEDFGLPPEGVPPREEEKPPSDVDELFQQCVDRLKAAKSREEIDNIGHDAKPLPDDKKKKLRYFYAQARKRIESAREPGAEG